MANQTKGDVNKQSQRLVALFAFACLHAWDKKAPSNQTNE